jgi:hypothetical protein
MGFAEVHGKVKSFGTNGILISPFSNDKCVYYKYFIEEYRSSGKSSGWVTVKSGKEHRPFYMQDETGRILVDPSKAKIDISQKNVYNSGLGTDPPHNIIKFLESINVRFEGILFGINKKMRFIEYLIKPNDTLYVMGTVKDNPFVEDATVVDGVADMIITKGKNVKFFCISDKMEMGVLARYTWYSIGLFLFGTIILVLSLIAIFKTVI